MSVVYCARHMLDLLLASTLPGTAGVLPPMNFVRTWLGAFGCFACKPTVIFGDSWVAWLSPSNLESEVCQCLCQEPFRWMRSVLVPDTGTSSSLICTSNVPGNWHETLGFGEHRVITAGNGASNWHLNSHDTKALHPQAPSQDDQAAARQAAQDLRWCHQALHGLFGQGAGGWRSLADFTAPHTESSRSHRKIPGPQLRQTQQYSHGFAAAVLKAYMEHLKDISEFLACPARTRTFKRDEMPCTMAQLKDSWPDADLGRVSQFLHATASDNAV